MNKIQLVKEFMNAVEDMKKTKYNGTYHWILGRDKNNNDWAIVLGWADGFDKRENDSCTDGTWRLCAKVGYQPYNSLMQCDYDWDWLMPYDEETKEVDNTEIPIYPNTDLMELIDWLLECYSRYETEMEEETMDNNYFEANEMCPHCECENSYPMWDVTVKGYIAICEHCGKEIFLCDECLNAEDNEGMVCDWCPTKCGGKCFRGTTKY